MYLDIPVTMWHIRKLWHLVNTRSDDNGGRRWCLMVDDVWWSSGRRGMHDILKVYKSFCLSVRCPNKSVGKIRPHGDSSRAPDYSTPTLLTTTIVMTVALAVHFLTPHFNPVWFFTTCYCLETWLSLPSSPYLHVGDDSCLIHTWVTSL